MPLEAHPQVPEKHGLGGAEPHRAVSELTEDVGSGQKRIARASRSTTRRTGRCLPIRYRRTHTE